MNLDHFFDLHIPDPAARAIVIRHSRLVADKALAVAQAINDPSVDLHFIEEAAMLHDIGVGRTDAAGFGCRGTEPYIRHGIIGREILEEVGLHRHALVCERHIGVGLTALDVVRQNLPLPAREMVPTTLEERIICFADLFYSKHPGRVTYEKSVGEVRRGLEKFGAGKAAIFDNWLAEFGG